MNIFVKLCKGYCGADVVTEYQFHPKRKWRFDYAIPSHKIAIEVEGGAWIDGRHNRASGFFKRYGEIQRGGGVGVAVIESNAPTTVNNCNIANDSSGNEL
jgi:hypothetical protein